MKKIYSFIALAIMAIAASAQEPLYTFETVVTADPLWGDDWASYFVLQETKVTVEVYEEDYVIIRKWGGVEGYDLKVEYDPSIDAYAEDCNGNIINAVNIYNGVEAEPVIYEGFCYLYTGRNDNYAVYVNSLNDDGTLYYSFLNIDKENKTGNINLRGYYSDASYSEYSATALYYYTEWPKWVNPFEGEATLLYSAVAKTSDMGGEWGVSDFPVVENIKVDVYDKYIYIHALGGVDGYDVKVAYNENGDVTSVITVTNGEESEPAKGFEYIYTGLADKYCLETYFTGYSYASSYEDKSGYVILGCYIYNADDSSTWSYYHISWEGDPQAINGITTNSIGEGTVYNLAGQQVTTNYKGIAIKNGKKVLVK